MHARTVVCVGSPDNAKAAALYFDCVIHLWIGLEVGPARLWPESLRSDQEASRRFSLLIHNLVMAGARHVEEIGERFLLQPERLPQGPDLSILFPKPDGSTNKHLVENYVSNVDHIVERIHEALSKQNVLNPALVLPDGRSMLRSPSESPDPSVVMSGLKLVDVRKSNWTQIMEFRKDEESVRRFRRLAVFMHDELANKPSSYIEDRVQTELEDYEAACKKHGFDTVVGAITTIIDHKTAIAAAAGSLIAGLAGAPLSTIVGTPIVIEFAGVSIKVARDVHSMRQTRRFHPMSYIMHARENLENT